MTKLLYRGIKVCVSRIPKVVLFLIIAIVLLPLKSAEASVISIKAPQKVSVGQRVSVDVMVDPENQSINSVESTLSFDSSIFSFNGFSLKQSSIPIWVEEPKEKQTGSVHFSGVIPGGIERLYDPLDTKNKSIPVVRLFFIAKAAGVTNLNFGKSLVLENDGKGTESPTTTKGFSVTVLPKDVNTDESVLSEDTTSPKPFSITIIEHSFFGKTPRLAVFSAEDGEGGIDRYEVAVGDLKFAKATSPFALPYRLFSYSLTVRAYDYSGNVREQQVTVSGEKPYGLGIALGVLVVGFIIYRLYSKVKRV